MPDYAQLVSKIPFLSGYNAEEDRTRAANAQGLQQVQQFMTLQGAMEDRGAKRAQMEREAAFRQGMTPNMTQEQLIQHAVRSGVMGAKDVATLLQTAETKKMQTDANKALGYARLEQAAAADRQRYETAHRNASSAEERNRIQEEANNRMAYYRQAKLQIDAGNYNYETGRTVDLAPFTPPIQNPATTGPQQQPGNVTGPQAQGIGFKFQTPEGIIEGSAPTMNAALRPVGLEESPAAVVSQSKPPAPAASFPVVPTPGQGVPGVRAALGSTANPPSEPVMPTFTGSPKARAEKENEWKMAQAKAALVPKKADPFVTATHSAGLRDIQRDENSLATVNQLEAALKRWKELNGQVSTGRVVGLRPAIAQPQMQEMVQLQNYLAVNNFKPGQGQISNFERQLIKGAGPTVNNDEETNQRIVDIQLGGVQNARDRHSFREMYLEANKKLLGADKLWNEYIEKNPRYIKGKDGAIIPNPNRKDWAEYFGANTVQQTPAADTGGWSIRPVP